jgi:hypothetical protein
LSPSHRRAILVVTVLETAARLTDETISVFDRMIGRLFRRAEQQATATLKNDARAINDKIRLFAPIGEDLLGAKASGEDPYAAIRDIISWDEFAETISEAKNLVRTDGPDYLALAERNHVLLRRIGPPFLSTFAFQGVAAAGSLLRALEAMRAFYAGSRRSLPKDLPTGFIRRRCSRTARSTVRLTSSASLPSFAIGSGPAMCGLPAAGSTARSRISLLRSRCSLR